jgi:hypothetical protein
MQIVAKILQKIMFFCRDYSCVVALRGLSIVCQSLFAMHQLLGLAHFAVKFAKHSMFLIVTSD